ncbi:MAG TPA: hypothetical protein VM431_15190 [Phycisphaerae bacterium]|nr:hypothetical protein [Phycisphaerae bacterium]
MADLSITAANVVAGTGADVEWGTAGEAITAGQSLYKKADNKMWKADDTSAAEAAVEGVALCDAGTDQPVCYITGGPLNPGAIVAVGTTYGVTDTAGGIGPISDRASADFVSIIGVATTTSNIQVAINQAGVAIP